MSPASDKKRAGSSGARKGLLDMARTLTSNLVVDGLLRDIVRSAERLTGAEAASLLLLDDEGRNLYFRTATGEKGVSVQGQVIPLDAGLAGWVVRHRRPAIVNDVARDPRFKGEVDRATGFRTRSVLAVPFLLRRSVLGVCEAINKRSGRFTIADRRALEELAALASVSIENARRAEAQSNFFNSALDILVAAIESTQPGYVGHPRRVAALARAIGARLGWGGATLEDLNHGALLHDVGLIAVNHRALLEKTTVREQERTLAYAHPLVGAELLKDIRLFRNVIPIVRHHHEAWDGSGHPAALRGEKIPLGARIVALIEQLEELRLSGIPEPELSAMQVQLAKNGSGTKFDPAVVDAFLSLQSAPAAS